jgi:hypothetical protein
MAISGALYLNTGYLHSMAKWARDCKVADPVWAICGFTEASQEAEQTPSPDWELSRCRKVHTGADLLVGLSVALFGKEQ